MTISISSMDHIFILYLVRFSITWSQSFLVNHDSISNIVGSKPTHHPSSIIFWLSSSWAFLLPFRSPSPFLSLLSNIGTSAILPLFNIDMASFNKSTSCVPGRPLFL
eukprot:NODE_416_length_7838_cov_1.514537.p8 type:complete len:107 gc:universal NODE_416_length_7838_cov_1.514537:2702-3022(+)